MLSADASSKWWTKDLSLYLVQYYHDCSSREDVAAGQIVSDPAFRRRLQPASAAPVPRTGNLTTPDCLCVCLSVPVQVCVHMSVLHLSVC